MYIFTHRGIADAVYHAVKDNLNIRLNYKSFRYGNIKPDICKFYQDIPHYKDASLDFIISEIELLYLFGMPKTNEAKKQFSEKLGTILHYIADYFCYAHNCEKYKKLIPHLRYEFKILRIFHNINARKIARKALNSFMSTKLQLQLKHSNSINNTTPYTSQYIKEFINSLHKKYMTYNSHNKDILFTLIATSYVSYCILSNCITNITIKAA